MTDCATFHTLNLLKQSILNVSCFASPDASEQERFWQLRVDLCQVYVWQRGLGVAIGVAEDNPNHGEETDAVKASNLKGNDGAFKGCFNGLRSEIDSLLPAPASPDLCPAASLSLCRMRTPRGRSPTGFPSASSAAPWRNPLPALTPCAGSRGPGLSRPRSER